MQRRRAVVFFWFGRNFKNWVSWPQFPCLDLLRLFVDLLAKTLVLKSLCGLQIRVGERFAILREETIEVSLSEREREIHTHTYTHKYTHVYPQWAKSILGILNRRVWKSCSRCWEQSVGWVVVVVSVRSWQQREVWRVLQLWSWNQGKRKRKRVGVCWTNTKHLEREREGDGEEMGSDVRHFYFLLWWEKNGCGNLFWVLGFLRFVRFLLMGVYVGTRKHLERERERGMGSAMRYFCLLL